MHTQQNNLISSIIFFILTHKFNLWVTFVSFININKCYKSFYIFQKQIKKFLFHIMLIFITKIMQI